MPAKLPSRLKRTMARSMCRSAILGRASLLPIRPSSFRSSSRPTMPSPARRAPPAWDWLSPSASLRCMAVESGSSRNLAKARHLHSRSRSSLSGRWMRRHEQTHSGSRGPGGQSANPPRPLGQCRISDDGSLGWRGRGVSAAKEQHPDLILMDIQLPHMDGYEATRRIKADPELNSIPIIAVTSYALSGDDGKAHAAGCDAYVTKPYSPRELLAKIRQYLPQ